MPKVARALGLSTTPDQLYCNQGALAVVAAPVEPALTDVQVLPAAVAPRFSTRSAQPPLPSTGALKRTTLLGGEPDTVTADSQATRLLGFAAVPAGKLQANWLGVMMVQVSTVFFCQLPLQYCNTNGSGSAMRSEPYAFFNWIRPLRISLVPSTLLDATALSDDTLSASTVRTAITVGSVGPVALENV